MVETRKGRPRSESTRQAILRAAADLVSEVGYADLTITGIATRAGSGKQTIYRWWTAKSGIVADAVVAGYLRVPVVPLRATKSLADDLTSWLAATVDVMNDPAAAPLVRALAAAASDDGQRATALWAHLTGPLHEALSERLTRGQAEGQLSDSADPASITDALIGTVLFRLLARQPTPAPLGGIVSALLGSNAP
ncbi:TetR/AcrR family transcriptional regulator [Mycetocola zhadangensis]|uniref:TetR/AcrR family transcriptional regulator n=1 Tax=Mycetocola zhadangensis TaxID=1164595 RepID=UPI003A4DD88D